MSLEGIMKGVRNSAAVLLASTMLAFNAYGQSVPVTGRVVDGATPLPNFNVAVFTSDNGAAPYVDRGITGNDGRFRVLSDPTDVKPESNIIPNEYKLSTPFPNPSSGISNVHFSVPHQDDVSLKVYDILGKECFSREYNVTSGTWSSDLDMKDYASGVYIVGLFSNNKLVSANKFVINKSVVQNNYVSGLHKVSDFTALNKPADIRFIDSIIVSGPNYKSSILRNVGFLQGDSVDVGDVEMYSGLANANVLVYDLFNWRDKNNHPIVGAVVKIGEDSIITDATGHGSFVLPATNIPYDVKITHPDIRTRETKVIVDNDKGLEFDVMTMESYPDSIYNFIDLNFRMRLDKSARWLNPPEFIFNVDTTLPSPNPQIQSWMQLINFNLAKLDSFVVPFSENPINPEGFLKDYRWSINPDTDAFSFSNPDGVIDGTNYVVEWYDSLLINYGSLALTGNIFNYMTGELYAARTVYDSYKFYPDVPEVWRNIDRGTVHELDTGLYLSSRYEGDGVISSVSNRGPPYETRNYTPNDLPIRLYLCARPPGTIEPDKDNGWCQYSPESIRKPSNLMIDYTFTMEDGRTLLYQEKVNDLSEFKSITKMSESKVKEMINQAKDISKEYK